MSRPGPTSSTPDTSLAVFQLNLGKGRIATAELRMEAQRRGVSVLILQELWTVRNSVSGMGTSTNRIFTGFPNTETQKACVVILDPSYDVILLPTYSSDTMVTVQITSPVGMFYVVSLYCRPYVNITPELNLLRRLKASLGADLDWR